MSLHRTILVALATVFAFGMTSGAFAGCGGCGWESPAPVAYAPPPAPAPLYAPPGCGGGCRAPVARIVPVTPLPVAPAPLAVDHWDTGGLVGFGGCGLLGGFFGHCGEPGRCGVAGCGLGGCGGFGLCGGCGRCGLTYAPPVAVGPTPVYVVNQGPQYSGAPFMIPFRTYSPGVGLAVPGAYPYISTYGPRYANGPGPYWRHPWYHRPLGVRG
jgi:hypothetical protein